MGGRILVNMACLGVGEQPAAALATAPRHRTLVIVLNFNGIADTLACLQSLSLQTCASFDVLVIDNGSRADDLAPIAGRFPAVETIALPGNLGWAGGNNVGLRLARERGYGFACLLNNDTVLEPTAIAELLAAAAVIGQPCLLHPAIFYYDDPTQPQLFPKSPASDSPQARDLAVAHDIVEMDYAYGACLLLPVASLDDAAAGGVGLLDERFFLQLEEQDYYRRAVARGMHSYCATRARMLHKESVSFGGRVTANKIYYITRNSLLLAEKHDATPLGILRSLQRLAWSLQRVAISSDGAMVGWIGLFLWLLSSNVLASAARQGMRDYLRRRFGARPVAPRAPAR